MKVPVSWLKEYVDIEISLDELADRLTMAGNEVESIDRTGWIDNVVVGRVQSVRPHPDADRLRLVTVDHGYGEADVVSPPFSRASLPARWVDQRRCVWVRSLRRL